MEKICKAKGCEEKSVSLGWCQKHYVEYRSIINPNKNYWGGCICFEPGCEMIACASENGNRYCELHKKEKLGIEEILIPNNFAMAIIELLEMRKEFFNIDKKIWCNQLKEKLDEVLDTLTPREEKVLRKYFYEGETKKKIAEYFGVSIERIRQIEVKALRKIRCHPSRLKQFEDFMYIE